MGGYILNNDMVKFIFRPTMRVQFTLQRRSLIKQPQKEEQSPQKPTKKATARWFCSNQLCLKFYQCMIHEKISCDFNKTIPGKRVR